MSQISRKFISPDIEKKIYEIFVSSISQATDPQDTVSFINDLLSPVERKMLAKRVAIAFLLMKGGYTYEKISGMLKVSFGTIAKINSTLQTQGKGYRKIVAELLDKQAVKRVLGEILDAFLLIPPKGTNWGRWKKEMAEREAKRNSPLL